MNSDCGLDALDLAEAGDALEGTYHNDPVAMADQPVVGVARDEGLEAAPFSNSTGRIPT